MKPQTLLETKDPRISALEYYKLILSSAKEIGEENKNYVANALRVIDSFYYDPSIVRRAANCVLLRIEREKARQLRYGNVFKSPDSRLLEGSISIGNVVGDNRDVFLTKRHINENLGIWGRAGSGKTNLCQLLTLQLVQQGILVRAFDYKDEYRDLLPHIHNALILNPKHDKFNPLEPIGNPKEWLQFLADTLQQDFNIKPETKFMWLNYADELYKIYDVYDKGKIYPSMQDMKEFLIEKAEGKNTSASRRRKIYTCLEVINSLITSIGEMLDCNSGYTEEALSNFSFVSYEMSNLSSNIQSWLSKLRLKHLYHKCFLGKERNRLKIVAIFEEAKMLFSESLHKGSTSVDYIKQLITQARASGFGAIVTDQNKNELADFVLNNLSCQICFNLASPKEARVTGYSLGCNEEQVRQIHYLKIPNAIMSISGHAPFMIKIPKSPVTKHISDTELKDLIQPRLANLTSTVSQKPQKLKIQLLEKKGDKDKKQSVKGFLEGLRNFLVQIKKYPELNISQLYHSLNLSGRKGDKIKNQLLDNKLILEEIVHTGKRKRPSKQLKITEKGDKLLQWLEKKVRVA